MKEVKYLKLKDIATGMYRGSGIKKDQVVPEGYPCVRYGEIYTTYDIAFDKCVSHTTESEISARKYFEKGDILFAITGESVEDIGKSIAYLGEEKCLLGGDIVAMKHNQNPKYLAYALSSPSAIKQKGIGKTKLKVVHTNIPSLKEIVIPIPSPEEQAAIVAKLDTAFAKIEKVKEDTQKALMEISDLRIAVTKDILLRNPANHPASLGNILKLRRGHDLTHAEMKGGIIPVAGSSGVIGFHNTTLGPSPCVTIGRSGSVGKVFYYDFCWPHNTSLYVEDYKGNNPRYIYHLLRNLRTADYRGGAAVPTLNRNNLHPIQVSFCPDIKEQAHISSLLDSLDEKHDAIEKNYNDILKECEQLKRSILKNIFE